MNIEISCSDLFILNAVLDIAEEYGGTSERKSPLMHGYCSYTVSSELCSDEFFELLR